MSEWITHDPKKTNEVLLEIKRDNSFRFGPMQNKLIDFFIENNESLDNWCFVMGQIARSLRSYLKENSPHEVEMIANNFSYLGGIPELDPKEVEETEKALQSMGIEVKDGKIDMKEMERVMKNLDSFEEILDEKDKNKQEDLT